MRASRPAPSRSTPAATTPICAPRSKQGKTFTLTVELDDGRIIAVVNQPIKGGGWVATHEDITERKRAERELEQTRSFLDTIIENVPSPIIVKDIAKLRYLLINRAAEKYLGVDRATMLGKTAIEIMPWRSAKMIEAEDRKLIASGKITLSRRARRGDARQRHPHRHPTRLPVNGADGKPQYLISVIHDVTDRKRTSSASRTWRTTIRSPTCPTAPPSTNASPPRSNWRRPSGESFARAVHRPRPLQGGQRRVRPFRRRRAAARSGAPAGGGLRGRLPGARRRRRIHRHHPDRRRSRRPPRRWPSG